MSPVPSEHLQRLRAGDEGAGTSLCRHFLPAIRCLALAGTLDPEVAEEVVRSTMSRLLERFTEVENPKRLMSFVEEVARDQIKGKLRESGGRYTQLAGLPAELAALAKAGEPDLHEIFGELPPERAAWMLLESSAFIPAHQQVMYLLRHLEGMDYEAIAELTGTSVEEVGKVLAGARRLFERELVFHLKKLATS